MTRSGGCEFKKRVRGLTLHRETRSCLRRTSEKTISIHTHVDTGADAACHPHSQPQLEPGRHPQMPCAFQCSQATGTPASTQADPWRTALAKAAPHSNAHRQQARLPPHERTHGAPHRACRASPLCHSLQPVLLVVLPLGAETLRCQSPLFPLQLLPLQLPDGRADPPPLSQICCDLQLQ